MLHTTILIIIAVLNVLHTFSTIFTSGNRSVNLLLIVIAWFLYLLDLLGFRSSLLRCGLGLLRRRTTVFVVTCLGLAFLSRSYGNLTIGRLELGKFFA